MRTIFVTALALMLISAGPAAAQNIGMGEELFGRCALCHDIGEGAQNRQGPQLNGLFGRPAASVPDFPYSPALREAGAAGLVWTPETVAGFIAKPKHFEPGTGMIFPGLRNELDIADVIAYLASVQQSATDTATDALELGRTLVETQCGGCHATGRDGASPRPDAPAFRTLHERYPVADLTEALVEGLVSGHPDMPEFTFEPDEADAIVNYLETLE
jgi:cytochrome c